MYDKLYLNQKIIISQSNRLCPDKIIHQISKQAIVKGFKKISENNILPIVEFHDKTRMWILYEESNSLSIKSSKEGN